MGFHRTVGLIAFAIVFAVIADIAYGQKGDGGSKPNPPAKPTKPSKLAPPTKPDRGRESTLSTRLSTFGWLLQESSGTPCKEFSRRRNFFTTYGIRKTLNCVNQTVWGYSVAKTKSHILMFYPGFARSLVTTNILFSDTTKTEIFKYEFRDTVAEVYHSKAMRMLIAVTALVLLGLVQAFPSNVQPPRTPIPKRTASPMLIKVLSCRKDPSLKRRTVRRAPFRKSAPSESHCCLRTRPSINKTSLYETQKCVPG
ncbi:hypothetical protein MTO96_031506 [Rhipicephalus appendiculatus]